MSANLKQVKVTDKQQPGRKKRKKGAGSSQTLLPLLLVQSLALVLVCFPLSALRVQRNKPLEAALHAKSHSQPPSPAKPPLPSGLTGTLPAGSWSQGTVEAVNSMGQAIWASGETLEGTVALFRHSFVLAQAFEETELEIIADTRYEVWFDGQWLGRGPARFSQARQEYDTFSLGPLDEGVHLVAALVQYAPNTRRSESGLPALQAGLRGRAGSEWQWLANTGTTWKAIISPAWDAHSRSISLLGLVGPMEVLDLRLLPEDWMQPSFDDGLWPAAQAVVSAPFTALGPRTIAPLHDVLRRPAAVVEVGLLSPGWQLAELAPPLGSRSVVTRTLVVTAQVPTTLRVEALDAQPISVDGGPSLRWQSVNDPRRPDVLRAESLLSPGAHTLYVAVPPDRLCSAPATSPSFTAWPQFAGTWDCDLPGGRTLALGLADLQVGENPRVTPVHDPGRRMLLANPAPGGDTAPQVQLSSDSASVYIPPGNTPRYVVLDLGRTVHARLRLMADGPAGTVVDAGWDERLTEGRPLPYPGSLMGNAWSEVDSWTLDGHKRQLTTLDTRAGRYLLLQVFGPGPVYLDQIQIWEETYAGTQVGRFASSDPLLDRIWQIGVDSLVPNMTDAYTDTPWRERGQWWGDAMISFAVNRAAFGDLTLFRRGLRLMADAIDDDGRPEALAPNGKGIMILDFGMEWIEGLYLYWTLSGDLDLVAELYPAARRLVDFVDTYRDSSGLLSIAPAHWSQSALIDWSGVSSRSGESTALNAQYSAVLADMGDMANALGDPAGAESYLQRSAALRDRINAILYLPDQGCYAASRFQGQLLAPSPHAQAWSLRYDVVPAARRGSTVGALVRQLLPFFDEGGWSVVEPLGMAAVLDALQKTGRTGAALTLIRGQYGNMIAQGATTWWELFTPNQTRGQSLSHAWEGSPTWFLSSHVLGGQTIGPGQWQVAPHPGDLTYASGAVPLDSGVLEIDWQYPRCGEFSLDVTAPRESMGDVLVPFTRHDMQVTLDGVPIWLNGPTGEWPVEWTARGLRIAGLGGGQFQIAASFGCYSVSLPIVVRQR